MLVKLVQNREAVCSMHAAMTSFKIKWFVGDNRLLKISANSANTSFTDFAALKRYQNQEDLHETLSDFISTSNISDNLKM